MGSFFGSCLTSVVLEAMYPRPTVVVAAKATEALRKGVERARANMA